MPTMAFVYVNKNDKDAVVTLSDERRKMEKMHNYSALGSGFSTALFFYKGYYCQYFPYLAEHSSLISFMARRFPRGLPEKCILVISSLHDIHMQQGGEPHRQISAASVFVEERMESAHPWLAYGASLHTLHFDQLTDSANPSYLPATTACTWAAAPPPSPARSHQHKHDERADDIWLVGILLLEMAYDGLRVRDRGELDSFLHKIHNKNKLPKKLNDDYNTDSKLKRASSPYLPACFNPKKAAIAPVGLEYMPEERLFSRKFVNLVLRCLNPDPAKRPTAHKLVCSKIFNNIREGGFSLRSM